MTGALFSGEGRVGRSLKSHPQTGSGLPLSRAFKLEMMSFSYGKGIKVDICAGWKTIGSISSVYNEAYVTTIV